jgi:hypothetical protein
MREIGRLVVMAAGDDRFHENKNYLPNGGTRKGGAFPDGGTARTDGRVCDERPSDGERQVIFVVFRERVTEAVGEKRRKRNLAELGEVDSWEQYRAVIGGVEAPKGTERRRERGGIVVFSDISIEDNMHPFLSMLTAYSERGAVGKFLYRGFT